MAAVVSLYGVSATFTGARWRAADPTIELLLNATTPDQRGDDPHYEQTAAAAARDDAGATILHVDDPGVFEPGTIF
jgi:hypothetical protein